MPSAGMIGGEQIVVAGEALVDLVLEPDGHATPHAGGGPFNAARTLGRLGLQALFLGRLSTDGYGRLLIAGLAQSGVGLDALVMTDDPTTFARVELDGDGVASYRFYIEGTSAPGLTSAEARQAMPGAAAALHVGGLGIVFEPQASAIAALVREASAETLVFLDPNCRPGVIGDERAYQERLQGILGRAEVVKASEEDLIYLNHDQDPLDAARQLLAAGPSAVLVTQGSRGARVITADREAEIAAPAVTVVDTIGAGDAFGAAWLAAWVSAGLTTKELDDFDALARATRFAVGVAARTCERAGAEPPTAAELAADGCALPAEPGTLAAQGWC